MQEKTFWLSGVIYPNQISGEAFYRSRIAIDVEEFENKFDTNVVGIRIEKDIETGKASWNISMIFTKPPLKDRRLSERRVLHMSNNGNDDRRRALRANSNRRFDNNERRK